MLTRISAAVVATVTAALLAASTSFGGANAAVSLRGSVGPGFTIKLTKAGKAVKTLKAGTYKITVADRSAAHNFVLEREGGAERVVTSLAFVGTKTVTVKLTRGVWKFYCEPHASVMSGRVAVGGAVLTRSARVSEPGDDRGAHAEPGDDRGANAEPGDDRGAIAEPGDDRGRDGANHG